MIKYMIRSDIQIRNILKVKIFWSNFIMLLYCCLMLVKLQAVVEQMWERDTSSLKIDVQIFIRVFLNFSFFYFTLFCLLRALFCIFLFAKRSFASV